MRSAILSFLSILLWQSTVVPATAQSEKTTVSGPAEVVTASVLEVGGMQLRLYGIAAPQKGERCPLNGRDIDCGHVAATQLMDLGDRNLRDPERRDGAADSQMPSRGLRFVRRYGLYRLGPAAGFRA